VNAYYADGSEIFEGYGWGIPHTFNANTSGAVYIRVKSDTPGTYAIVFSLSDDRPGN
jgi:hypothetical protein